MFKNDFDYQSFAAPRKTDSLDQVDFLDLMANVPFPVAMFDLGLKIIAASTPWIRAGRLYDSAWLGKRINEVCRDS